MLATSNYITTLSILTFLCILLTILLAYVLNKKNKTQLDKMFTITFRITYILDVMFNTTNIGHTYF